MAVFRRDGWGGTRAALTAAGSDLVCVRVAGGIERTPTLVLASFSKITPGPAEAVGKARLLLYEGSEPTQGISPYDAKSADGFPFVKRVWLDATVAYGEPVVLPASGGLGDPVVQQFDDWWLIMGVPVDSDGLAFDAVAALTLWGFDDIRRLRFR